MLLLLNQRGRMSIRNLPFHGTTILFGAVVSMLVILFSKENTDKLNGVLKGIGLIGLAAIVIQLVYLPVYVAGLPIEGGMAGLESANLLTGTYAVSVIIRWVSSIAGFSDYRFCLLPQNET